MGADMQEELGRGEEGARTDVQRERRKEGNEGGRDGDERGRKTGCGKPRKGGGREGGREAERWA
eukprot:3052387-Rhodomonas_salina.2